MDGAIRSGRPPHEVQREFVGFRLERQVLVRVYELAVPFLREHVEKLPVAESSAVGRDRVVSLSKGA
jgi:hypothetical protein